MDMTEGVVARFRVMAISRGSVLTGRVVGSLIRTLLSIILVVGVAVLIGFRPTTGPAQWLLAYGFLALVTLALTWLAIAFGMAAKTVAGANSSTLLLQFGPFISSGFVPASTMPAGVRWFAENQPRLISGCGVLPSSSTSLLRERGSWRRSGRRIWRPSKWTPA